MCECVYVCECEFVCVHACSHTRACSHWLRFMPSTPCTLFLDRTVLHSFSVTSAEDPEKLLDQVVQEMQGDLIKMRQAAAQV